MKLQTLFSEYRKWNDKEIQTWRAHRAKGLISYVIYQGVLRWGVTSLVIFLILSHQSITLQSENPQIHLLQTSVIWLVLAVFYGLLTWKHTNASYDIYMSRKERNAARTS